MIVGRVLNATIGTIGLIAVGFAVVAAVAPGELESVLPIQALVRNTPLSEASVRGIGLGIIGAICAVWVVWTTGTDRSKEISDGAFSATTISFRMLREDPPEHTDSGTVVGGKFDGDLVRAANQAANGDDPDPFRDDIRSLAIEVVAYTEGCSESEAESIVEAGEWTDDAIAAAYVTDGEATLSLRHRFLAWLRPTRTKRNRVDRAIRAIDRHERGSN